jgi:hypothetical protein
MCQRRRIWRISSEFRVNSGEASENDREWRFDILTTYLDSQSAARERLCNSEFVAPVLCPASRALFGCDVANRPFNVRNGQNVNDRERDGRIRLCRAVRSDFIDYVVRFNPIERPMM